MSKKHDIPDNENDVFHTNSYKPYSLENVSISSSFGDPIWNVFFFSVIFHPLMNSKAGSPCEVERREALGLEGAGSAVFLPPTHGFSYHVD